MRLFPSFKLLLSIADLAQLLNTSSRTVHRLKSAGLIPSPVRIGCRPRWRREEIAAWLEAGCPDRKSWMQLKRAASRVANNAGPEGEGHGG